MTLSCSDFQEDLSSFVDGELDEHRQCSLADHLTSCRECKLNYDHYRGLARMLQASNAELQQRSDDIWNGVASALPTVCEVVQEDLSAYVDGELPPAAQEGVSQHLTVCDPCQDRLVDITKVNQALAGGLPLPAEFEVDLWSGIKARLNEDCVVIKAELSAFIDREVATLRHREITAHLTECGDCKNFFNALSNTGDTLRAHYQPDLPADFDLWPAIETKIKVATLEPKQRKRSAAPMRKLYATAAAVLLGVVASTSLLVYTHQSTPQIQPVTAEAYLIDQSMGEPADVAEAVVYDHND